MSQPPRVIRAAGGLRIALRDADAGIPRDLGLGSVAAIALPGSPAQEAFAVDGRLWRRLWCLSGRMVVDFVDVAAVEVRDGAGSVTFDRDLPVDLEEHLLLDHVLPLVMARRGMVVLHGAVLALDDRAAVLVGPSGAGKSTLTTHAGRKGWTVGGDDGAVLNVGTAVTVEPTYPTIRLTPEAMQLLGIPLEHGAEVAAGKRRLGSTGGRDLRRDETPVALIAFLDPVSGEHTARFTRLGGMEAHTRLLGATFHADMGPGPLLEGVFHALASVADGVPVGRLQVPRGLRGLDAAEEALRRAVVEHARG